MSDYDFLTDLSERLRHIPVSFGVDGRDIDRLREVSANIVALTPASLSSIAVKPLDWKKADEKKIEIGRCHSYSEHIAYVGNERHLHWFRVYPVSDGKWRWVEQFRMTYINGNTAGDPELNSAVEAMAAADAFHAERVKSQITLSTRDPEPEVAKVPAALLDRTFAIEYNPNCPSPWLVRLIGESVFLDLKRYSSLTHPDERTGDILGFGRTIDEAATDALNSN